MHTDPDSNEIRLTRVYDAPLRAVWDAWTVPAQVERWWGPRGFTLTTHHKDLRTGGTWRYTMHGPDGVDHPNVATYHVVEPLRRLVYDHGATDDSPPLFHVTATFAQESGDRTRLELVFALASPDAAAAMAGHIRRAGGNATWDRLAEHLEATATGRQRFVVNRTLPAPIGRVFAMWADPGHLARWLPPAGTRMRYLRQGFAVGESAFVAFDGEGGAMHARFEYLAIEPPRRIVYTQQFVDAEERPTAAPWPGAWPATLLTTVLLAEEAPGRTRVTVTSEPHGEAAPAEIDAFARERAGMTGGWTASFDVLERLIAPT